MSALQKIRRDSKAYAIHHESGHLVVGVLEGKKNLSVRLARSKLAKWDDAECQFEAPLTPSIAVAGFAAVALQENPAVTAEQCAALVERDPGVLSATDRRAYPPGRAEQIAVFDRALLVLRHNKPLFDWACERLRANAKISAAELRAVVGDQVTGSAKRPTYYRFQFVTETGETIAEVSCDQLVALPAVGDWFSVAQHRYTVSQKEFIFESPSLRVRFHCIRGHRHRVESVVALADAARANRAKKQREKP